MKTNGNPLFIENYIQELINNEYLLYKDKSWHLSVENISDIKVSNSVFDGLISKIDSLEDIEIEIINKASAIGDKIDFEILEKLAGTNKDKLVNIFNILIKEKSHAL